MPSDFQCEIKWAMRANDVWEELPWRTFQDPAHVA